MRIAIVINTSWNIYNFRKGLIKNLLKQGHEVFAIAPQDDYSEKLKNLGCHYVPVSLDNKGSNVKKDFIFLLDLYFIYKKIKPDIILHYTIKPNVYGTIAAYLRGIPCINNVSGLGTVFLRDNWTSKIALTLYKIAFLFPKKVFFQNKDDKALFIKKRLIKRELTDILPGSGIDLNHFKPAPFIKNETFTFLLIARLLFDKGIIEYIKAIKTLRRMGVPAHFQLLGLIDHSHLGITQEDLNSWIKEGLIEYLGFTEDVRPSIYKADCIVLPSYREGTPRTLLEAASLAKPIIATNVPGCTEIVVDEVNGFLCEVKNPRDLAYKMIKMIELSTEEIKEMGVQSRKQVERKFDEKEVISKYNEALVSLFGREKIIEFELPILTQKLAIK